MGDGEVDVEVRPGRSRSGQSRVHEAARIEWVAQWGMGVLLGRVSPWIFMIMITSACLNLVHKTPIHLISSMHPHDGVVFGSRCSSRHRRWNSRLRSLISKSCHAHLAITT